MHRNYGRLSDILQISQSINGLKNDKNDLLWCIKRKQNTLLIITLVNMKKKPPKHSDKIGKVTCCIRKCIIAMWANILVFQGCPHKILVANGEWATVNFKP